METIKKHVIKNPLGISLIDALYKKYEAEEMEAFSTLKLYLENPVGIGEHSDMLVEYDKWVTKLTDAKDKKNTISSFFEYKTPVDEYDNTFFIKS